MMLQRSNRSLAGRELDPKMAVLAGEGAGQRVTRLEPQTGSPAISVWRQVPSRLSGARDYYEVPMLKEPVWIWSVPLYFYIGGVAGGSAVLAAALHGKAQFRDLTGKCRWLAFLGTTIGPGLLTWDLGRRFRFLNMLRVFRPTSPMSVGSWTLAASGLLATLALARGDSRSAAPVRYGLGGGGLMLAGYTGVLLSNSANPFWGLSRNALPVLFTASAMASTSGVLELLPAGRREQEVIERFGTIGKIAEAGAIMAVEREVGRNPEVAKSFGEGRAGFLWKMSKVLLAAGIVAGMLPRSYKWKRLAAGLLTTGGSVSLRYALMALGRQTVRNPRAVDPYQPVLERNVIPSRSV